MKDDMAELLNELYSDSANQVDTKVKHRKARRRSKKKSRRNIEEMDWYTKAEILNMESNIEYHEKVVGNTNKNKVVTVLTAILVIVAMVVALFIANSNKMQIGMASDIEVNSMENNDDTLINKGVDAGLKVLEGITNIATGGDEDNVVNQAIGGLRTADELANTLEVIKSGAEVTKTDQEIIIDESFIDNDFEVTTYIDAKNSFGSQLNTVMIIKNTSRYEYSYVEIEIEFMGKNNESLMVDSFKIPFEAYGEVTKNYAVRVTNVDVSTIKLKLLECKI